MKSPLMLGLVPALILGACGPPRPPLDLSGGPNETGEESSTTDDAEFPSTESETDTDTDASDSETFVPEHDTRLVNTCDPFVQDCPDGEKCVPYSTTGGSWDANKCVPVTGEQATGEPCTYAGPLEATDDCDASGACWNVLEIDGELIGTCHAFCMGSPDEPMCPAGSQCLITGSGSPGLCIPQCDPIEQDCEPGLGCYWGNNDFQCFFTTENIPAGEPCGYVNDCAPGHMCLDAGVVPACEGSACCGAFCDLNLGPEQCDAVPGTSCVSFFEQGTAPPGTEHYGVCILP